ncbi:FtsX-like permease family protein [Parabacteroides acidifaciens]|uniref:ABC transporter permease n=1 Tax=Parabacteroides acidifaciens TaxID=2290935 RepID=A0A3D8HC89_9BACT|nr:FtsX-like permease family protein [Parabacteroides acidifaciens]MBC8602795.1 FtsX-like permease family protein [Parabacteroides acidifaciens]RDU48491.1 ABC transporter permease [Parabacteroides acidifaciens]
MILHYIKIAYCTILRYKLQNAISVAGLSVGLLCFSLCLYCSRFMLSIDSCFRHHKRIADIQLYLDNKPFSGTPASFAEVLKSMQYPEIEDLCRTVYASERPFNVWLQEEKSLPYTFQTMEVDTSYYHIFTPDILFGSWQQAANSANSAVITETTARKVFKNASEAIGKQLELSKRLFTSPESTPETGGIYYTIRAVIKDLPTNTSMHLMRNIDLLTLNDSEGLFTFKGDENMTGCCTYALLQQGKSPAELDRHFIEKKQTFPLFKENANVRSLQIGHDETIRKAANGISWLTGTIGLLILLTGLLDFFYFMIGQFMSRTHEYSIRKVNGSSSFQLFVQLFTQSFLLIALTAVLTGCLLEQIGSGLQIDLFKIHLTFDSSLLLLQTGEYILLILLACMAVCLLTVLRIRRISIQKGIRGGELRAGKHYLRNTMLGIQFFICWLFVSLTFALYLQTQTTTKAIFNTLSMQEKESIFSFSLDYSFMKTEEKLDIVNRIRQQAGVKDVLLADEPYTEEPSHTGFYKDIDNKDSGMEVQLLRISPNFFTFMQIPLQSGRTFSNKGEILADETFMQKHPDIQFGTSLYNYADAYSLCGVASSFFPDIYNGNIGTVFLPADLDKEIGHCYIKTYPGQEKQIREHIYTVLREVLPSSVQPYVRTFKEDINEKQALESKLKGIILFFTIVCLIITLLGVYSAITLDTEHRQKEVAVRKVNGASSMAIIRLFALFYIKLLLFSALPALALVILILHFWKQMYIVFFEQGFFYWGSIFFTILLLTTCTVIFRIRKAANQNPAEVIKTE